MFFRGELRVGELGLTQFGLAGMEGGWWPGREFGGWKEIAATVSALRIL